MTIRTRLSLWYAAVMFVALMVMASCCITNSSSNPVNTRGDILNVSTRNRPSNRTCLKM